MRDVVRLCPWDDEIAVAAVQVGEVLKQLYAAGRRQVVDPPVLVVVDAGYDLTRLAFVFADRLRELPGRMRSARPVPFPAATGGRARAQPERAAEIEFEDPVIQPVPSITTTTDTTHYGRAVAAWDHLRPLPARRSAWADHPEGQLQVVDGTVIRPRVDHLRGDRSPRPV